MSTAADFLNAIAEKRAERERQQTTVNTAAKEAETVLRQQRNSEARLREIDGEIQAARNGALVAILTSDVVDVLAPEHRRGGCSDGCLSQDNGACPRCTLRRALSTGYLEGVWMFTTEPVL